MATSRTPPPAQQTAVQSKLYLLNKYNRTKAEELERYIREHVQNQAIEEDGTRQPMPHIRDITKFSMQLPVFIEQAADKEHLMLQFLIDNFIEEHMENQNTLNWCRDTIKLFPFRTTGDGNCLLHAASIGMWGIHDYALTLRQLLHVAMTTDCGDLKDRYRKAQAQQNLGLMLQSVEFTQDWEHMVALASTERLPAENALPFHSLEDIHIFVLAQLLRRPIIVLSEAYMRNMRGSVLAPNHAPGIYLPLLWPPELCVRSPLVLAYFMNHFSPLIPRAGDSDQYVSAVPLVSSNSESLCVHYMTDTEESQVTTKLEMYLDLIEVPAPVGDMQPPRLAARLTRENLAPNLDLIVDFEAKFEEMWHQKGACRPPPESPAVGAPATSNTGTCITPGCKFFGSKDFGGRCSCCHRDVSRVLESGKKKCSVTKCVNTIEKVEHEPYCNFHSYLKQHSASHPPPPKAHTDTLPSKQRVTDPDLLAGARGKTGLEPTGVKGTTAPEIKEQPPRAPQRRATEPLPARGELLATVSPLCRIPGCHLKAKPEFDHQCKQHYALQQAKELAENVKPILLPKCTRCNKMSGVSHFEGMCGECYTAVSLAKTKADPSKTPVPPPGPECSTKNCSEVGMEEKGGLCLDCYNRSLTLRLEASARNEKDRVGGEETEQKLPFEIETETIPDRPTASAAQAPKESATRLTENATLQAESKRPASVVTQTPCETALKPTENPPVVKRTETYAKPKEQSPTAEMMGFEMLPEKEDTQTEEAAPTEFKQDVNPATEEPSGPPVDHLAQLKLSLEGKENTPSPVNPPVDEETVKFGLGENSSSFDRSISSEACSSLIVSEGHSLPEEPKPEVLNRKTSTTSLSSSNVSAVTEVKCAYSACANRVQDPNKKLCEDCHTILTQVKEKRKTRNSSTEQMCASGCGKPAGASQQGYCTACHRRQLSDPASQVYRSSSSVSSPRSSRNIKINMGGSGTVMIGTQTKSGSMKKK